MQIETHNCEIIGNRSNYSAPWITGFAGMRWNNRMDIMRAARNQNRRQGANPVFTETREELRKKRE